MNGQHKADEAGGVAPPLLVQIWQRALCHVLREDSTRQCRQQGKAPGRPVLPSALGQGQGWPWVKAEPLSLAGGCLCACWWESIMPAPLELVGSGNERACLSPS